jgi:hypothetical protein
MRLLAFGIILLVIASSGCTGGDQTVPQTSLPYQDSQENVTGDIPRADPPHLKTSAPPTIMPEDTADEVESPPPINPGSGRR